MCLLQLPLSKRPEARPVRAEPSDARAVPLEIDLSCRGQVDMVSDQGQSPEGVCF